MLKLCEIVKKCVAITFALILVCTINSRICALDNVPVSAQSAILIDAESGSVIFEKDAEKRLPMASTTKIMTALIALESGNLDRTVVVDENSVGIEGSSLYLKSGETLTMEELLYGLLLASANDAATAIACEIAGNCESFAVLMNERAQQLGLSNTHFTNPHGLDDSEHYTSAHDLATLTTEAMQNESFREIVSTVQKNISQGDNGVRCLVNHNRLLKSYDGAVGVKTGYTRSSGRCLVSAANREGVKLIAVTLNAPNDWEDHRKLLDYGFEHLCRITVASPGDIYTDLPLIGGTESSVRCKNHDAFSVTVPRDTHVLTKIEANRYYPAPISEGDALARAVFTVNGVEIGSIPLFADRSVDEVQQKSSVCERILKFIGR